MRAHAADAETFRWEQYFRLLGIALDETFGFPGGRRAGSGATTV
jgi:hypothetical protein